MNCPLASNDKGLQAKKKPATLEEGVAHIVNVTKGFFRLPAALFLPSELFNHWPQGLELVEHPKVPIPRDWIPVAFPGNVAPSPAAVGCGWWLRLINRA